MHRLLIWDCPPLNQKYQHYFVSKIVFCNHLGKNYARQGSSAEQFDHEGGEKNQPEVTSKIHVFYHTDSV